MSQTFSLFCFHLLFFLASFGSSASTVSPLFLRFTSSLIVFLKSWITFTRFVELKSVTEWRRTIPSKTSADGEENESCFIFDSAYVVIIVKRNMKWPSHKSHDASTIGNRMSFIPFFFRSSVLSDRMVREKR